MIFLRINSSNFVQAYRRDSQWRSQDLEVGAQWVWETEVPQRGPGAENLVGGSGGHSLPKAHSSYSGYLAAKPCTILCI